MIRIPIRFETWYAALSTVLGLPPSTAYIELDGDVVTVRMGFAFRSRFPRSAIVSASPLAMRPLSRGVHGFAGRWLVNGAGREILGLELSPPQRAHVVGVPIRLRQLLVSVADAAATAEAIRVGR